MANLFCKFRSGLTFENVSQSPEIRDLLKLLSEAKVCKCVADAVCCSVFPFVAVLCNVYQCAAVWCSVLWCVAVRCCTFRGVVVRCSMV